MHIKPQFLTHRLTRSIILSLLVLAVSLPVTTNAADDSNTKDPFECQDPSKCNKYEVSKMILKAKEAKDYADKKGKKVKDEKDTAQENENKVITKEGEKINKQKAISRSLSNEEVSDQEFLNINDKSSSKANDFYKPCKAARCASLRGNYKDLQDARNKYFVNKKITAATPTDSIDVKARDSTLVIQLNQYAMNFASSVASSVTGIDENYKKAVDNFNKAVADPQNINQSELDDARKAAQQISIDAIANFDWKIEPSGWNKYNEYNQFEYSAETIQAILDNPMDPNKQDADKIASIKLRRNREFALLNAIDRFPSASSLVGSPGFLLSGSSTGSTATVKTSFEQIGYRYVSLTLSAPTAKSGNTNLATLDGLPDASTLEINFRGNQTIWSDANFLTYGIAPQVGSVTHTYYASSSATQTSSFIETTHKVSAYTGMSLGEENNYFMLLKYQVADASVDKKTTTVCPALSVKCEAGSFGLPTPNITRLISVEGRYSGDGWAIATVITRDYKSNINGVDIPLYFIPTPADAKQPGLTGGIDIGWRSDSHGSFGLFVGSNFDLFGN